MAFDEFRRDLGVALIGEIEIEMSRGEHVALLGPRGSGKSLVVGELAGRARVRVLRDGAGVVELSPSHHRDWTAERLVGDVAGQLGIAAPPIDEGESVSHGLVEMFRQAVGRYRGGVWVFVTDTLKLPTPLVRGLLKAFQVCVTLRGFAPLVTGNDSFLHLTYGPNSPYRHAKKFLIRGLDLVTTARYLHSVRAGRTLQGTFEDDSLPPPDESLEQDALILLHEETGGSFHLVQEVVASAYRHPVIGLQRPAKAWSYDFVSRLVALHEAYSIAGDSRLKFALRTVEQSPDDFDLLRRILRDGSAPHPEPDPADFRTQRVPEVSGLVRSEQGRVKVFGRLLERYLRQLFDDDTYIADVMALQHRWAEAWPIYEKSTTTKSIDRPSTIEGEGRLQSVIREWEDAFIALSGDGVDHVVDHLVRGSLALLGFDLVGVYNRGTEPWLALHPLSPPPPFLLRDLEPPPAGARNSRLSPSLTVFSEDHLSAWSVPTQESTYSNVRPIVILWRDGPDRTVDADQELVIRRAFDRFWHVWAEADRIDYDRYLGALRKLHLHVIRTVNDRLLLDSINTAGILECAGEALLNTGQYLRIQFCLVDGPGQHIQAVWTRSLPGIPPIDFPTHESLVDDAPIEAWDIQRWVWHFRKPVSIPDATDPNQMSPTTQRDRCIDVGMKGFAVVPMIVQESVLGTIHFERPDQLPPSRAELELFVVLAGQIASAVQLCQRMTFLERSLELLPGRLRIVDPGRRVIYSNKDDAQARRVVMGWKRTDKTPDPACPCEGCRSLGRDCLIESLARREPVSEQRYYRTATGRSYDWMVASIDDHRDPVPWTSNTPDPRIGYIEYCSELTALFSLYSALSDWLKGRGTGETAGRILDYFRARGFRWCRIYLTTERSGRTNLTYLAQFGLVREENRRAFRAGRVAFDEHLRAEGLPWPLFNDMPELLVLHQNPAVPPGRPTPRAATSGYPEYDVHEPVDLRRRFEKEDDACWIEAPLRAGRRIIGLLSLAMPSGADVISPLSWGLLQWTVLGVAVALDSALRAEREVALQRERLARNVARRANHQLRNALIGPLSLLQIMNEPDFELPARWKRHIPAAYDRLQRSMRIIKDYMRYSGDYHFPDRRLQPLRPLLARLYAGLSMRYPDVETIDLVDPGPDVTVDASESALSEVLDVLMDNTLQHSGLDPDELVVRLWADRVAEPDDPVPEPGGRFLRLAYRDNGRGVPGHLKVRIFEPTETTSTTGSGLGLSIARDFVTRLGGSILEHGEPGRFALFSVVLEINRTNP